MSNPILSIKNVDVFYQEFQALDDVSFEIQSGHTYGLIGLNGAGKTTLIKVILGLREIQKGQILIAGRSDYSQEIRQKFVYLPERFNPPSFLKGIEFLRFSLKLYRKFMTDAEYKEAAERVALSPDFLMKSVNTYSKGMRQKLGLLGTVLTGCEFLILDEPMSGLDPRARAAVKEMLKDVRKEGRTIFLSSHILADMNEICDCVSVLHDKKIIFTGKPDEMLKQTKQKDLEKAFLAMIDAPKDAVA